GSYPTPGVQATLRRVEATDGRAVEATGHAENHRAGRKRDRRVYPTVAGSSQRIQRVDSTFDGAGHRSQRVSLRNAVRGAGRWPVLQYPGFLREVGPFVANHQCGRPDI